MSDFRTNAEGRKPRPLAGIALQKKLATHCPKGHEYSPENVYFRRGYRYCKACMKLRQAKNDARPEAREKKRATCRRNHQKYHYQAKNYGLTPAQYEQMVADRRGLCDICSRPQRKKNSKRLCIDHDHLTGEVRGLLCDSCNVGIARFEDNTDFLARAVLYLGGSRFDA